jgi:hypothetical protein
MIQAARLDTIVLGNALLYVAQAPGEAALDVVQVAAIQINQMIQMSHYKDSMGFQEGSLPAFQIVATGF